MSGNWTFWSIMCILIQHIYLNFKLHTWHSNVFHPSVLQSLDHLHRHKFLHQLFWTWTRTFFRDCGRAVVDGHPELKAQSMGRTPLFQLLIFWHWPFLGGAQLLQFSDRISLDAVADFDCSSIFRLLMENGERLTCQCGFFLSLAPSNWAHLALNHLFRPLSFILRICPSILGET